MSITICDTHLVRTVRYLSLTFEPVYKPIQYGKISPVDTVTKSIESVV